MPIEVHEARVRPSVGLRQCGSRRRDNNLKRTSHGLKGNTRRVRGFVRTTVSHIDKINVGTESLIIIQSY